MATQNSPWPPFPPALLERLRALGEEEGTVRLLLWNGERVPVRKIVEETADGVIVEADTAPGEPATMVAVPWQAIAGADVRGEPTRRSRPGFRPA